MARRKSCLWSCWRWVAVVALVTGMVPTASAYYHFVRYTSARAPFVPVRERFDVAGLPNKTVGVWISERGPTDLAAGDSLPSVVSQIRLAAQAWNQVETSELRLALGGFSAAETPPANPSIEVVFDEVPPGLIAVGGPSSLAEPVTGPQGLYVPIQRSTVILNRDLRSRPSHSEAFFLSVVHELGHAIGLQHSQCSSVMSTEVTRATTKAQPLAADDIAGVSLLYPTRDFLSQSGTITGRVTAGGVGVVLASVVALPADGAAVSTLTHPDGSYRLEGLPPGRYFVYVHPLAPGIGDQTPANLVLPRDAAHNPIAVGAPFDLQFYPASRQPSGTLSVQAGQTLDGISFAVQARPAMTLHSIQTYGFPGQVAVKPPHIQANAEASFLVAAGYGVIAQGQPVPSLRAAVVGGDVATIGSPRPYQGTSDYLRLDLRVNPGAEPGPRHLLWSTDAEAYMLPSAFQVALRPPPSLQVQSSDTTASRTATVSGSQLGPNTRFLVDGVPAPARPLDDGTGRWLLALPAAAPGHRAVLAALNPDGQSSLFLQGNNPPAIVYDGPATAAGAALSLSPSSAPSGTDSLIEITVPGAAFQPDEAVDVLVGSPDVALRRVAVSGSNRVLVSVAVAASAVGARLPITVVQGLRVWTMPNALSVYNGAPRAFSLAAGVRNMTTGGETVWPGSMASVAVNGTVPSGGTLTLWLNDQAVPVLSTAGGALVFQVPAGTPRGPARLRLQAGGDTSPAILVLVDAIPPRITALTDANGTGVDASRPIRVGQPYLLGVQVPMDLPAVSPRDVAVTVGNAPTSAAIISTPNGGSSVMVLRFVLTSPMPASEAAPLVVTLADRSSDPLLVPVR